MLEVCCVVLKNAKFVGDGEKKERRKYSDFVDFFLPKESKEKI